MQYEMSIRHVKIRDVNARCREKVVVHCKSQVIIHKLLVYTIVGCAGTILAEGAFPNNVVLSLARAMFVILQGTWFMQIAVMMYNGR